MKTDKRVLLSVLALMACGPALAAELEYDSGNGRPVHFRHAKPLVVIRQSIKSIQIASGDTNLDKPKTLTCKSAAGCIVTAKVWVSFNNMEFPTVSAYVDGVPIDPRNIVTGSTVLTAQQSLLVSQGDHTVQTKVTQQTAQGTITGWNIEYAQYEKHVAGTE